MEEIVLIIRNKLVGILNFRVQTFDAIPSWLLCSLTLLLLFCSPELNDNEEQYLQLAKQFFDSNWIVGSANLTEKPGTRFLYQLIFGWLLQFLSFPKVVVLFRALLSVVNGIVVSKIFKKIGLGNAALFISLVFFICVFKQNLFAGSWMFISVEPKSFGWTIVLISFYKILKKELYQAYFFLSIATYFHVLVGGYSFIYFSLVLLCFGEQKRLFAKRIFKKIFLYLLLIIPLLLYLLRDVFGADNNDLYQVSSSWIYTYFRSPHHTALFKNLRYFYDIHFIGVLVSFFLLVFAFLFYNDQRTEAQRFVSKFVIVSLLGTLFLVPLALIDRQGVLLKFYPYRINTLSLFMGLLLVLSWLRNIVHERSRSHFYGFLLLVSLFIFIKPSLQNINSCFDSKNSLDEVCDYIRTELPKEIVVFSFDDNPSITRKMERSRYVVYKFIPAELSRIHNWYDKVLKRNQVVENVKLLRELVREEKIDLVLSRKSEFEEDGFIRIYENSEYSLFEPK